MHYEVYWRPVQPWGGETYAWVGSFDGDRFGHALSIKGQWVSPDRVDIYFNSQRWAIAALKKIVPNLRKVSTREDAIGSVTRYE